MLLVGAAVAAGAVWYFWIRKPAAAATPASPAVVPASSQTAMVAAPSAAASNTPAALGNPTNPSSIAFACNAAWRMNAIGHPQNAAPWAAICQGGGGVIPTSAAAQYR
jgi:hypothetical protein